MVRFVLSFGLLIATVCAQAANPKPGEPTNAKEVAAQKAKADADLDAKYQAWVVSLPPEQQAWERVLQENLGGFYLPACHGLSHPASW